MPDDRASTRVPPGQRVTTTFYTLTAEPVPQVDPAGLRLRFWGEVDVPTELTWSTLVAGGVTRRVADFHCVTGWSLLGTTWGGTRMVDVLQKTGGAVRQTAHFVMVHAVTGFTANLPLDALLADDTMLVWEWQGKPLAPEHGGPLRLLVPSLYAWKDVKWVCGFEFLQEDRPGFWESRGYHMHGDPWKEERYA